MARKRSRTARLRAPFVATVAAASVSLPACGGNMTGTDGQPTVSGECPELSSGTSCDPAPVCPSAAPEQGAFCDIDRVCEYGSCYGYPTTEAHCIGGQWQISNTSCNPPPPPLTDCPSAAPEQSAFCNFDPSGVCEYGDCYGSPTTDARCVGGQWQVLMSSCNPPAPAPPVTYDCPVSEPVHGTFCSYNPAGVCGYGNCYGTPVAEARCVDWVWQVIQWSCNPPPPACPLDVPAIGTPCSVYSPCYYGDCSYDGESVASCVDGFWQVTTTFCEAPAPQDAGAAPVDGGAF